MLAQAASPLQIAARTEIEAECSDLDVLRTVLEASPVLVEGPTTSRFPEEPLDAWTWCHLQQSKSPLMVVVDAAIEARWSAAKDRLRKVMDEVQKTVYSRRGDAVWQYHMEGAMDYAAGLGAMWGLAVAATLVHRLSTPEKQAAAVEKLLENGPNANIVIRHVDSELRGQPWLIELAMAADHRVVNLLRFESVDAAYLAGILERWPMAVVSLPRERRLALGREGQRERYVRALGAASSWSQMVTVLRSPTDDIRTGSAAEAVPSMLAAATFGALSEARNRLEEPDETQVAALANALLWSWFYVERLRPVQPAVDVQAVLAEGARGGESCWQRLRPEVDQHGATDGIKLGRRVVFDPRFYTQNQTGLRIPGGGDREE